MEREKVFSFTATCYNGQPASCTYACPYRLDLRAFLKKAARGRWDAAYKEFCSAVLFPAVVCELCPRPCERHCQRETVVGDEPVSINAIERACREYAKKLDPVKYAIVPKEQSIAVVGAGITGLTLALIFSQKGFPVTVFDRNAGWGGALREHDRFGLFDEDFARQFSIFNVEFRFNSDIQSLAQLDEYDAVFVATGPEGESFGLLGGMDRGLFSTENPRVFLGGGLLGLSFTDSMAQARKASRSVESFLLSGSPSFAASSDEWNTELKNRWVPHPGEASVPRVNPAGDSYTSEEAQQEAARCMQCDCNRCMNSCELLVKYNKKPPRIGNDVFMDGQSRNSVSSASITRQTWSCNLCGRCVSKCHEGADVCGLFQYSREDRVESGYYPPALHDYWLREMSFMTGEASFAAVPRGKEQCEYAFFPGCRLGAAQPERMKRAYGVLAGKYGAGLVLNCCGVPAWWAGDKESFASHIAALRHTWESMGKPAFVTACPTCDRMLESFLPEIERVSLYMLLRDAGVSAAVPPFDTAAVFDPCAAHGKDGFRQPVRELAAAAGISLTDFDNDGECCGFGGHMQLADPKLYAEIVKNRAGETAEPYVVYCTNCREVFASQGKASAHILDILFGIETARAATLDEKRKNALQLKKELMKEYWDKEFEPAHKAWDGMPLRMVDGVQEKMERLLITMDEVREAVWNAERESTGFVNAQGETLVWLTEPVITVWASYKKDDNGDILVTDVYSHRVRIRGKE